MLSRRAVSENKIPYFPLDALFGGLVRGAPESGVTYDDSFVERPHKMWSIAKQMLNFFLEEEKNFLVEGDSILPSQINELLQEGKQIRSCFLGYADLTKEEKLALVRKYHQGETDWTRGIPDEEMLRNVEQMIDFSKFLKEECAKYNLEYFDVSHDFEGVRDAAFAYLFSK